MPRKALLYAFATIAVLALALTGWTFQRFLDSYRTLQLFNVDLTAVTQKPEGPGNYSAVLRFTNQGPVATSVDGFYVLLQWDKKLIAVSTVQPDDLTVPANGERQLAMDFSSNLGAQDLPVLAGGTTPVSESPGSTSSEDGKGHWTVKLYMRLSHPERRRSFRLDVERKL